jgi:CHAT domain-containing protein
MKIKLDSLLSSLDSIVDEIGYSELEKRLHAINVQATILDDKFSLAKCAYYKAKGFQNRGKIDSAMYYFKKCGAICIKLDFYDLLANCEFMLARIYGYNLNDYLQSELSYQNVIDYSEKIDDDRLTRYILLGRTHNNLQLYQNEKALRLARKARDKCENMNDHTGIAHCLHYISEAFINNADYDSALVVAKNGANLRRQLAKNNEWLLPDYGYSLSSLALIYQLIGDDSLTTKYYTEADSVFTLAQDTAGLVHNNIKFGLYRLEKEDLPEAKVLLAEALDGSSSQENTIFSIYGLALCDYFEGDIPGALGKLRTCTDLVELTNQRIMVPEAKTGLLSDKMGIYNLSVHIYTQLYLDYREPQYLDSALLYLERSRCRTLFELLCSNSHGIINQTEDEILRRISDIYRSITFEVTDLNAASDRIALLEDSLMLLRMRNHEYGRNEFAVDMSCLSRIRKELLDEQTVILEYMLSDFGSYVFVISKNEQNVFPIDRAFTALQGDIAAYIDQISAYPPKDSSLSALITPGQSLYGALLPSSVRESKRYGRIIIVPAGILHYLPFETLIDTERGFLVESLDISYAPSLNTLHLLSGRRYSHRDISVLAFGISGQQGEKDGKDAEVSKADRHSDLKDYLLLDDLNPLPGSLKELQKIESIYAGGNIRIYRDSLSTVKNFKNADLSLARYIHITAHGFTNDRYPQRSAIVFWPEDDRKNGLLQTNEIAALQIQADLVFLSACRSGSGKSYPGEGVLNLARPFFKAGTKTAIVTYWNIGDISSADLVGYFYSHLKDGTEISSALTQAKRELMASRDSYRHPYYWAPYILIGAIK